MDTDTQVTTDQVPVSRPVPMTYGDLAALGNEDAIAHDVARMWETHRSMQRSVKDSQKELQKLGKTLGEDLFFMKVLLAKPGRNGKWSEFLRGKEIPRTSGDRLVAAYERALNPDANCTNGAIQSPTQDEVRKLCSAVWSRVSKRLTSGESLYWFICNFALMSGARHELRGDGILVFESPSGTAEELSSAAAPPPTEQPVAVADASSSHALQPRSAAECFAPPNTNGGEI